MIVYTAGPLTHPDPAVRALNVAAAVAVGRVLVAAGLLPFVPHTMVEPFADDYEAAMRLCLAWVRRCDAVLRLPGASPGADREVALARELGLPVFASVDEVIAWEQRRSTLGVPRL